MRWSQTFIPTLKEVPADAEIISHQLLVRAGLVRKLTGGLYTFLPMGLRSLQKIENIVREEMNRTGAIEVLMPFVRPSAINVVTASGRWLQVAVDLELTRRVLAMALDLALREYSQPDSAFGIFRM